MHAGIAQGEIARGDVALQRDRRRLQFLHHFCVSACLELLQHEIVRQLFRFERVHHLRHADVGVVSLGARAAAWMPKKVPPE